MAKESGIVAIVIVDDSGGSARTISNSITDFSLSTPRNMISITGLDKLAEERAQGLADLSVTFNGVFDDGSNLAHAVFSTVPSSAVARTTSIAVSGQTLASECFFSDYMLTRSPAAELTWSAPGVLTGGAVPTWS
jgi:hypothetical protein